MSRKRKNNKAPAGNKLVEPKSVELESVGPESVGPEAVAHAHVEHGTVEPERATPEPDEAEPVGNNPGRQPWPLGPTTALALVALLATGGLVRSWDATSQSSGVDFIHYWLVPRALDRDPDINIYAPDAAARLSEQLQATAQSGESRALASAAHYRRSHGISLTGSPAQYATLAPLVSGDYDAALKRFRAVCLALFTGAIALLCWMLGLSLVETLAAIFALTLASDPALIDAKVGNVNRLQVAMLALFLWLQRDDDHSWRQLAAGAIAAWALLFKPNVGPAFAAIGLLWLADHRWRKAALVSGGGVGGGLLCLAVTDSLFGRLAAWSGWGRSLAGLTTKTNTPFSGRGVARGNYSLVTLLQIAGTKGATMLTAATVAATALCLYWGCRPGERRAAQPRRIRGELAALGAGLAGWQLSSGLVWAHYLNLLAPPILALLGPAQSDRPASHTRLRQAMAAAAAVSLIGSPLHFLGGGAISTTIFANIGIGVTFALCLEGLVTRHR